MKKHRATKTFFPSKIPQICGMKGGEAKMLNWVEKPQGPVFGPCGAKCGEFCSPICFCLGGGYEVE